MQERFVRQLYRQRTTLCPAQVHDREWHHRLLTAPHAGFHLRGETEHRAGHAARYRLAADPEVLLLLADDLAEKGGGAALEVVAVVGEVVAVREGDFSGDFDFLP